MEIKQVLLGFGLTFNTKNAKIIKLNYMHIHSFNGGFTMRIGVYFMDEKVLRIENLSKNFKKKIALSQINIEINKQDIIGLVGGNGAGKSTLIKCIGGLVKPTTGSIIVNGGTSKTNEKIGIMLEGAKNLYHFLTVEDNLNYFSLLNKINPKEIEKSKEDLLNLFDLQDKRNIVVNKLSRGMQQKVSLMIVFLKNPDILILDEPTLGLDLVSSLKMKKFLKEFVHNNTKTVIICSHDLDLIQSLCNKIMILKDSKLVFFNDTNKLFDSKKSSYTIYFYFQEKPSNDSFEFIEDNIYAIKCDNLDLILKTYADFEIVKIESNSAQMQEVLAEYY